MRTKQCVEILTVCGLYGKEAAAMQEDEKVCSTAVLCARQTALVQQRYRSTVLCAR